MPNGRKRARTDGGASTFVRSGSRLGKKGHRRVKKTAGRRRKAGRSKRGKRAKRGVVAVAKRKGKAVVKRAAAARSYLSQYHALNVKSAHYPFGQSHRMVTRDMNSYSRFPLLPTSVSELVAGVPLNPSFAVQPAVVLNFSNVSQYVDTSNWPATSICAPSINASLGYIYPFTDTNLAAPDELALMSKFFKKCTVEAVHYDFDVTQVVQGYRVSVASNPDHGVNPMREPTPVPGFWVFSYIPPKEIRKRLGFTAASDLQLQALTAEMLKDVECTQQYAYQYPSTLEDPVYYDASAANQGSRGYRYDWKACATPGLRIKFIPPTTSKDKLVTCKFSMDIDLKKWYGYSKKEWELFKTQTSAARMAFANVLVPAGNPIVPALNTPNYTTAVDSNAGVNCLGLFGFLPDFAEGGARYTTGMRSEPVTDYDTMFYFDIKVVAARYLDLDDPIDQIAPL